MTSEACDLESMSSESHLLHNDPPKGAEKERVREMESGWNLREMAKKLDDKLDLVMAKLDALKVKSLESSEAIDSLNRRVKSLESSVLILKEDHLILKGDNRVLKSAENNRNDFEFRKVLIGYYRTAAVAWVVGKWVVGKDGSLPEEFKEKTLQDIWKIWCPASHLDLEPPLRPLPPPPTTDIVNSLLYKWIQNLSQQDKVVLAFVLKNFEKVRNARNTTSLGSLGEWKMYLEGKLGAYMTVEERARILSQVSPPTRP